MIPEPDYSESEEETSEEEDGESNSDISAAVERLRDLEEKEEDEDDIKKRRAPPPSKAGATKKADQKSATSNAKTASSKPASPKTQRSKSPSPKRVGAKTTSPKARGAKSPSPTRAPKPTGPASRTKKVPSPEEDHLIKPKKPTNPYLESTERVKLHKELKFSQKYGKNGGKPRSELQRALEKYTENKLKRDLAACKQTSLEKILEQQAKKIEMQENQGPADKRPLWMDRLQNQQNLTWTDPKTDEFYRVHARVVSNFMSGSLSSEESGELSSSASRISDSSSSDD